MDPHEYALGHFFHDLFHELLHVDGKIVRTLQALLTRPGQLTLDYWEGRRARYLPPLRMYLIATALFFAFVTTGNDLWKSGELQKVPELKAFLEQVTIARFDARVQLVYKVLLAFSVAGFAWAMKLMMATQRPWGAYLISGLHSLTYLFLLTLVTYQLDKFLHARVGSPQGILVMASVPLIYWPYVGFSMRRWSGKGWGWVAPRLLGVILLTSLLDVVVTVLAFGIATVTLLLGRA